MRNFLVWLGGLGLLVFAFGVPLSVAPTKGTGPANDSKPRTDRFGDPLPDGAVARLGTVRWRCPLSVELVHFLEDGKQLLVCCGDGVIRISDAASGKPIRCFGNRAGCLEAVTTDGATVAQATPDGRVHVWSVATGKETCSFDTGFQEELRGLCFIKGEQLVGWGARRTIKVWDVGTGKLARVLLDDATALPGFDNDDNIFQLVVSPDGTALAFTRTRRKSKGEWTASLSIWSLKDGKPRGEIEVPWGGVELGYTSLVFSPDSKYFAWPEKDGTILLYQSASLEKVRSLGKASTDGRVEGACFSGDGKTLAALTPRQTIRLLDVGTGRPLREIGETVPHSLDYEWRQIRRFLGGSSSSARPSCCSIRLAWSPASKLIVQAWGSSMIRMWDPETGKGTDPGTAPVGATSGLMVSADGKSAVTLGRDNTVRTWEVATTTEQRKVSLPPQTDLGILLGPRRVLLHTREGSLSVWDSEKEKELVKVQRDKEPFPNATRYDVSRDGKSLLTVEFPGLVGNNPQNATLYNLETGAVCRGVERNWIRERKREREGEELVSLVHASGGHRVVATIADTRVALGLGWLDRYLIRCKQSENDPAFVWETRATKPEEICWAVSFTPDDRAILTFNRGEKTTWVSLLESMTGNERCRFRIPVDVHSTVGYAHAFSRNGDLLAVGTDDGTTIVIDIRRAREITRLNGDQGLVCCLAFSDAATLFTAGSDGTVLIWDIREHIRKAQQAVELAPGDEKRLWTELADPDTVKAYRALGALVTAQAQAVGLFREKLKPVKQVPATEIDKLIADLDNQEFNTQQQASRELRQIGPQAKAALKKSLERSKSLEQRKRIEELLAELKQREAVPSQDELRELRAIEVLEAIGTEPALSILESLAEGASGISFTDEAAAALERGKKKSAMLK